MVKSAGRQGRDLSIDNIFQSSLFLDLKADTIVFIVPIKLNHSEEMFLLELCHEAVSLTHKTVLSFKGGCQRAGRSRTCLFIGGFEESPGSTKAGCRVTPGQRELRDSATERKLLNAFFACEIA